MNKNKYLLIIFGLLLLFLIWKQFITSDDSRNFRKILVELDTASVTKIRLITKNNESRPIDFTRDQNMWKVSNGVISDEANTGTVRAMLAAMIEMKPKRLVARTADKWSQYEVNDSTGTRVQFYNNTDVIADLIIGKFSFEQTTRAMSTFVRRNADEDTYAIDGMLSSTFNQDFNGFRDKLFLNIDPKDVTSLKFDYPGDSSFHINKLGDSWNIDNQPVDSVSITNYLNGLRNITQREFADDFSPESKLATYMLTIDGNNMPAISINVYTSNEELILHSSQNQNTYFKPGSLDVFNKLLVTSQSLLEKQE